MAMTVGSMATALSGRSSGRWGGVLLLAVAASVVPAIPGGAAEEPGHRMTWDAKGMIMGENRDQLPIDCQRIRDEVAISVHVGRKYAKPGWVYGYSAHAWRVPPCSRVTVNLVNEDRVRHMWMLHGLPKYIYLHGMFHMEAEGGQELTGTFIVPSADKTYLVHCDMPQHTEKGLKAQLQVGSGSGDLPSIPGLTPPRYPGG
jgi:hypothetical protein